MQRYIIWAAVVVALGVTVVIAEPYVFTQPSAASGPAGLAGQAAPVLDLVDDRGETVSVRQYRGSIVVMNLWASWCPPCRAEMPDLQRLADERTGRVAVIGINEGESAQRARAFALSLGIRFPIWLDAGQRYGRTYAALGLPTTVILDRRGVVIHGYDGQLSYDQMRAAVAAAMQTH